MHARPRRSVLYLPAIKCVPAINTRALTKIAATDCDTAIPDLEEAVAPARKAEARATRVRAGPPDRRDRSGLPIAWTATLGRRPRGSPP